MPIDSHLFILLKIKEQDIRDGWTTFFSLYSYILLNNFNKNCFDVRKKDKILPKSTVRYFDILGLKCH